MSNNSPSERKGFLQATFSAQGLYPCTGTSGLPRVSQGSDDIFGKNVHAKA